MEAQELQPYHSSSPGRTWLASRILHRQVVNTSTLAPVGRINDVIFDPERCRVAALSVQLTPTESGLSAVRRTFGRQSTVGVIGIEHVIALNGDVVMVDSGPVRSGSLPHLEQLASLNDICELTILTLHGTCIGSLADVLLDSEGRIITGYVVNPTKQAEPFLVPLEDLLQSPPRALESEAAASDGPPPSESAPTDLMVIPASPRVRIGETLIVVLDDVEPLRRETVVITSNVEDEAAHAEVAVRRSTRHNGFYLSRSKSKEGDKPS